MAHLTDDEVIDRMAADFLRKHRHGVDTSEAYDDLRQMLASVKKDTADAAARLVRGLHGGHGLIFQEAAAVCIEKLGH